MVGLSQARSPELLVERRFPLHLEPSISSIRNLYDAAKQARWDPQRDLPWAAFDATTLSAEVREAARLSWSRRAWTEYGGLPETPALIVRFCMEDQRESDPKYFLTVRSTEEAWHLESCHRFAEALGGFIAEPADPRYAALFNQALHRDALDAAVLLDAYVAAHVCLQDGLDLELYRCYRDHARIPLARAILDRLVSDKTRHAAFGWMYLGERARLWSAADRAAIAARLEAVMTEIELAGFRCVWLDRVGCAADIVAADRITRDAGLGAACEKDEKPVVLRFLDDVDRQFAGLGVAMPKPMHPRLAMQ